MRLDETEKVCLQFFVEAGVRHHFDVRWQCIPGTRPGDGKCFVSYIKPSTWYDEVDSHTELKPSDITAPDENWNLKLSFPYPTNRLMYNDHLAAFFSFFSFSLIVSTLVVNKAVERDITEIMSWSSFKTDVKITCRSSSDATHRHWRGILATEFTSCQPAVKYCEEMATILVVPRVVDCIPW